MMLVCLTSLSNDVGMSYIVELFACFRALHEMFHHLRHYASAATTACMCEYYKSIITLGWSSCYQTCANNVSSMTTLIQSQSRNKHWQFSAVYVHCELSQLNRLFDDLSMYHRSVSSCLIHLCCKIVTATQPNMVFNMTASICCCHGSICQWIGSSCSATINHKDC